METEKIAEEFPAVLKEWRKERGLSQKKLSELLNVAPICVSGYESGKVKPSVQTAEALIRLGFQAEKIPTGKSYIRTKNTAMTDEERAFAEEHFNLVYCFLNKYSLKVDDWYDTAVYGYLHAVQIWFLKKNLHQYSFSTIAYLHMKSAVSNERKKELRRPKTVSLDEIIPGTDNFTYGDMLCDPRDCVGI